MFLRVGYIPFKCFQRLHIFLRSQTSSQRIESLYIKEISVPVNDFCDLFFYFLFLNRYKKMSLFTRLFSFPMKENFPVHTPLPGIYLTCVNANDCRDSFYVQGSHNPRPVIYGVNSYPPGFVKHDSSTCPVPRTSTFQTLEEFFSQDFLQTFTDCLKRSDFSTRGAKAMGFSSSVFFEGSSVSLGGQRVKANLLGATLEYSYECCMQPSFYIANVRGLQSNTPYYNPMFTTVHDFNCFPEDGCFSGGSIKNVQVSGNTLELYPPYDFPTASPRSVMWYMQHAIATIQLDDSGVDVDFWEGGTVGNINAIGGTLEHGGLPEVLGVIAPTIQNLAGNAALFQAIKHSFGSTDTPSQAAQKSFGIFSCPSTVNASVNLQSTEPWNTNLMYPVPDTWALSATPGELDCCTRGTDYTLAPPGSFVEGGQGEIPQNLSSFLVNSETQTQHIGEDYTSQTVGPLTCTNYHCLESPYCQSLLKRACKDFSTEHAPPDFNYGGYCTRWRNWASNNYASIQPLQRISSAYPNNSSVLNPPPTFNSTAPAYPSGAYMSSVDQSVFSLIDACSSTDFSQPQPKEVLDQCRGLLSVSTQQTTFPRLRPLTFDTPIQYSHEVVTPYTVDSSNNQIDIYLTYTQYVQYPDNVDFINKIINRNQNAGTTLWVERPQQAFVIAPQIENVLSFSINLDNFVSLNSTTFYEKVRSNFNVQMAKYNGNFQIAFQGETVSQQTATVPLLRTDNGTPWIYPLGQVSTIQLAKTNHFLASISWVGNSISVADTLINTRNYIVPTPPQDSRDWTNYSHRLENLFYLYDPRLVIWNSLIDFYDERDQNNSNGQFQQKCTYTEGVTGFKKICSEIGVLNNFFGIVFDQASNIVDVTQPQNLARVDDRFTFVFNPSLGSFLGLGAQGNSVTVNLNALKGGTLKFTTSIPVTTGTVSTFSQGIIVNNPDDPITPFNLINHAEFWLTNTTPIPIVSLSVLNYSGNNFYTVSFDPPSNPSVPLLPGQSVTAVLTDPSDPDNSGSYTATPILFYDAGVGGWQNNFQSPDFPVLGGFLTARGIDISTQNSYGNGERFSSFSSDNNIDFGEDFQGTISTILTYYANQNLYSTGEANSGGVAAISQMFLSPLL